MNASRATFARIDAALTHATLASPRPRPRSCSRAPRPARIGQRSPSTITCAGAHGSASSRPAHREQRRLQDVQRVDLGGVRPADAPGEAARADLAAPVPRAPPGREHLRVGEARDRVARVEDDGRGDDRPGQRSAPRFVDAGASTGLCAGRSCPARLVRFIGAPRPLRPVRESRRPRAALALRRSVVVYRL